MPTRGHEIPEGYATDGLIACPTCDALHRLVAVPARGRALCRRCGTPLYRHLPDSLDRSAALYLAALILFGLANAFPFITLKYGDRIEVSRLVSGGFALYQAGMVETGALIFLTSVLFPCLTLAGMLYMLLPLRFGLRPPGMVMVWRGMCLLNPWSLIGVFMLGLLVSVFKLQDMATIIPGPGFYLFALLLLVSAAAVANFDPAVIWPRIGPAAHPLPPDAGAEERGYLACPTCSLLVCRRARADFCACPRCASRVRPRRAADSLSQAWALLATAAILLVPANLFPVMTVIRLGMGEPSTILSGVMHLIRDGAWPLGLLVLFASVVVPIGKIAALAFLLRSVRNGSALRLRERTRIYHLTEVVGAWSMVDIFLVGILVALVRMEGVATVYPGIGASFFGAAVVATLMAAHAFDPRLLWRQPEASPVVGGTATA